MKIQTLASAIYEILADEDKQEFVVQMQQLSNVLINSKVFRTFLLDPSISSDAKTNSLLELSDRLGIVNQPLLEQVFNKLNQLPSGLVLLGRLGQHLSQLYKEEFQIVEVDLYSANDLSSGEYEECKQSIIQCIATSETKHLLINKKIDSSLIAGIKIQTDNFIVDSTVKKYLSNLESFLDS